MHRFGNRTYCYDFTWNWAGGFSAKVRGYWKPETVALIGLGNSGINCNIISNGKLVFNRIISTVGMKTNLEKLANIDESVT